MTGLLTAARGQLQPTRTGHRVTSLELFFDLVFVYAIANISVLVEHDVGVRNVVEGAVTLSLVWFAWCSYAWLGNQARADEGLLRVALVVATAAMLFVAISIPYAFVEHSNAAVVLVVAYAVTRLVHNGVYLLAAGDDAQLRSVVLGMLGVFGLVMVPLVGGVVAGAHTRLWWWLAAIAIDQVGVYFVRSTRWRLNQPGHFAERFGNIVLIAIGESLVGLGTATSVRNLSAELAGYLALGIAVAVCLWWTYFDIVALVAEHTLTRADGLDRARIARDSFTYLHLPLVAGIESTALGLGLLIHHEHVDAGRGFLFIGVALYLVVMSALRKRDVGVWNVPRLVTAAVFVAAALLLGVLPGAHEPAWLLAVAAGLLVALVALETHMFRRERRRIRDRPYEAETAAGAPA